MPDVVVVVPKSFGLARWIAEGDPAGAPWSGEEWHFSIGRNVPRIDRGERVYVVYNGVLRGYAPLVRVERTLGGFALVRHGGAEAVSLPYTIESFRGWRYRWWQYAHELPFPAWRDPDASPPERA